MRHYPTGDVYHYWEYPSSWSLYCRTPNKSWSSQRYQSKHAIAYWRDLKGSNMDIITNRDLHHKSWPCSRIRTQACLPQYYCVSNRYIDMVKIFPSGFKFQVLPLNLREVRAINEYEKQKAKMVRSGTKQDKRLAKKRARANKKQKSKRL